MLKPRVLVISVLLVIGVGATAVTAATWNYVGTSGFTVGQGLAKAPRQLMSDGARIVYSSTVVDAAGNIYVVANNVANAGVPGGVSIFKPQAVGYDRIDVNLVTLNLFGGITKLVLAGDGKVYACQNWRETKYQFPPNCPSCIPNRILRINPDGTVGVIYEAAVVQCPKTPPTPGNLDPQLSKIGGMAVGGDGKVYWWQAGANKFWQQPGNNSVGDCGTDTQWRQHVLWRYNLDNGPAEEAPINLLGVDNGNTDPTPPDFSVYNMINMYNFEYIGQDDAGNDWFAVIQNIGAKNWKVDIIGWYAGGANANQFRRRTVTNGDSLASDPAGRNFITALVYDPAGKTLWAGGVDQDINGKVSIMTRWVNGNAAWTNPGLIHHVDPNPNQAVQQGITAHPNHHANGNGTGSTNHGRYWVASLAVSPVDSRAWMAWGGECSGYDSGTGTCAATNTYNPDASVTYGALGHVFTMAKADTTGPSADEGRPQSVNPDPARAAHDNQVVALAFSRYGDPRSRLRAFAVTADLVNGEYSLFWAYAEPQQIVGACCEFKCVCGENMTQQACAAVNGVWQGPDTTCAQTNCAMQVCNDPFADVDCDGDVDQDDFSAFQVCYTGEAGTIPADLKYCACLDVDGPTPGQKDGKINQLDMGKFEHCASGPNVPADPCCDGGTGCP